jgi:hypothetical protein
MFAKAVVTPRTAVAQSAAISTDARVANEITIPIANASAFTMNAPSNPTAGQRLTFRIKNISAGALGVATWNAVFKMAPWVQPAAGQSRAIDFQYDGANWIEVSRTPADVPN